MKRAELNFYVFSLKMMMIPFFIFRDVEIFYIFIKLAVVYLRVRLAIQWPN